MRVRDSIAALAFFAVVPSARARAEDPAPPAQPAEEKVDPLKGLSGKRALEFAKELSSDAMKGRKTGFEGGRLAEDWVAGKFVNFGLDPEDPDGDYLDPFTFSAVDVVPPIALSVDGAAVEFGTGYTDLLYTGQGTVEAEVVFAGFGISTADRGWDDYAGIDVKGKIVLALRGAPEAREGDFQVEKLIGYKSAQARDHGAAAFLIVEGKSPVPGTIIPKYARQDLPALWIASAVADKILAKKGTTLADLRRPRDAGEPGTSFATGTKAKVEVHAKFSPQAQGRNALAGIPGSDPDLKGEVIVVGAHMDHLGVNPMGLVFNGADDNASGTATMLMLAETMVKNHWRPKRTIVFVAFAGEEQGLVGSKHLAADPPFPNTSIVAMFNMDQTGQGTTDLNIGGGEGHPALWSRLLGALPEPLRATVHPFRVAENSDHWPFFVRGIPSFFAVTAGEHPNYHQVSDDIEGLKPECMEAAARVVGSMVVALADEEKRTPPENGLADYLLHEGPRVVEGPRSTSAVGASYTTANPAILPSKDTFIAEGWTGAVVSYDPPPPKTDAGGNVEAGKPQQSWIADLLGAGKTRAGEITVLGGASDITNAAKGGRICLLPRLDQVWMTPASAPGNAELVATRSDGWRWVKPFRPSGPPTASEREAALDILVAARIVIDLTGLPQEQLPVARARLKDHPATYRLMESATVPSPSSIEIARLRAILGPKTLLVTSSAGAATLMLSQAALEAPPDPTLAPVVLTNEDTNLLRALIEAAHQSTEDVWENPDHRVRARIRSLLGGAWIDLLRRL